MEMGTQLGTFVDFDEVIVPPSGVLLLYAEKELSVPGVGALQFTHSLISVKLSSDKVLFDKISILNPIFLKKEGPVKVSVTDKVLISNFLDNFR